MLAFKMKKPMQQMGMERQLLSKVDVERWGPAGREIIQKIDGMRERMREASQSYSEKGAAECREVMGRYQALVFQGGVVCQGIDLKPLQLGFRWADAFEPAIFACEFDWTFERACVIFNLAASISFLATHEDRTSPDGLKTACALYQQSAGALHMLQDIVKAAPWRTGGAGSSVSADLAADTISSLESLMLAQAQKCFFEKAEGDGMTTKVLAMLTAECAALYDDVGLRIDEAKSRSRPISSMTTEWLAVVQWNRLLFDGLQHYYLAKLHEEANEYGKALARLAYATDQCARAVNACAGSSPVLQELFKRHFAICKEAHTKAKKDNDLVHYDKVPDVRTLPKPDRKCMVKATTPSELGAVEPPTPLPPKAAAPPAAPEPPTVPADPPAAPAVPVGEALATQAEQLDLSASEPPPPSMEDAETAGVVELVSMGFSEAAAKDALRKSGGSVQAAADMLLSAGGAV